MDWKTLTGIIIFASLSAPGNCQLEDLADEFLANYSAEAEAQYYKSVTASWNYNTNLTDYNSAIVEEQALEDSAFTLQYGTQAKGLFTEEDINTLDEYRSRQIESIQVLGTANLNETKQKEYNQISTSMDKVYSTSCATLSDGECHSLDPDLTRIMATSRDYYELKDAWKQWYETAGRPIKDDYERFAELSNEAYAGDGYVDTGAYWRSWYETENFEQVLEDLWLELKPMYLQLHAYVRRKLYEKYGPDFVNLKGPIPSHLLGNMWAQTWGNVYELVEPFQGKSSVDATPQMLEQGYDAQKMFEVSEEFFTSLGLLEMTEEFWNFSMIVKPEDREVVCHASAWDFYHENDFRIKMCTVVNMEDLITIHHEMGHIQYFQQYKDQPVPYRNGANPGFHEAVGDTLALSVSTPKHLQTIGLLSSVEEDDEADINYLMSQALEKIAFLPFGYLIDKWRWSVFDGTTAKNKYQSRWDELRLQYQGIVPPVTRDDAIDFDPGAKYHIPGNTPYIRYFVSFVIQFQFYEAMCNEAGHTGPLYKCDFYNSKEAGTKLAEMLKLGSSKKWPEAMVQLTGGHEMSTLSLQKYFEPLTAWLKEQNEMNGDTTGWDTAADWRPKGYYDAKNASAFVSAQNASAEPIYYNAVLAEWTYNTDITEANGEASSQAGQVMKNFYAEQGVEAKKYDPAEITDDPTTSRLITKMSDLGTGALTPEKLAELSDINVAMQTHYSSSKVCGIPGTDSCVPLDPDLTEIMATSRDYNKLRDAWKGWRDVIGTKETRDNFEKYVELNNEAAVLNNYDDMGAYWRSSYETPDFDKQLEKVWREVLPLYEQLHAYVRRRLHQHYGDVVVNRNGPIPAHLLGNMWAQDWTYIYDLVEPYPGKVRPDATPAMIEQGWDPQKMFEVADKFFSDMGLIAVPQEFWDESMIVKPLDREVVCHASAWDFYNRKDFRIKMCTTVNQLDFVTIHHELGHIQYYLQYKDLHVMFREGANNGFHEAVGDTLSLSVSTLQHLYKLGLIDEPEDDPETNINYLMSQALDKIAFLPFGYLIDKWRWDVFSGRSALKNMNQEWWDYRIRYQGVTPPVSRSERDFDPPAKFHISNDVPYIRYFVSFIIQFQFYEALCNEAGHTGPLYKCDFNGSTAAGEKLGNMLKLGSSVTWEEALRQLTGTSEMSSASLLNYFSDLQTFLEAENAKFDDALGWPEYMWTPPNNTIVLENGRVQLDDGNGATAMTSSVMIMTLLACIVSTLIKFVTE